MQAGEVGLEVGLVVSVELQLVLHRQTDGIEGADVAALKCLKTALIVFGMIVVLHQLLELIKCCDDDQSDSCESLLAVDNDGGVIIDALENQVPHVVLIILLLNHFLNILP